MVKPPADPMYTAPFSTVGPATMVPLVGKARRRSPDTASSAYTALPLPKKTNPSASHGAERTCSPNPESQIRHFYENFTVLSHSDTTDPVNIECGGVRGVGRHGAHAKYSHTWSPVPNAHSLAPVAPSKVYLGRCHQSAKVRSCNVRSQVGHLPEGFSLPFRTLQSSQY